MGELAKSVVLCKNHLIKLPCKEVVFYRYFRLTIAWCCTTKTNNPPFQEAVRPICINALFTKL